MSFSRRFFSKIALIFAVVALTGLVFGVEKASAAKLFLERAGLQEEEIGTGENILVKLTLDSREQSVNAIEGRIVFPADILSLEQTSQADSILSFWVEPPEEKQSGEIVFSGIVPGGYNGADGHVLSFDFLAKKNGIAQLNIEDVKVLLNDGKGTELGTLTAGFNFTIGIKEAGTETEKQTSSVFNDNTPPEPFTPAVSRHEDMFDGQWFVSFYARDNNLGIDHYEIIESTKKLNFDEDNSEKVDWIEAESPNLLKDQNLRNHIYIKAIDKAGNETIASVEPQGKSLLLSDSSFLFIKWGTVLFIVLIIASIVIRKILKKKHKISDVR